MSLQGFAPSTGIWQSKVISKSDVVFYLYGQPDGPEQSVFGKHIWKGHSDSQPDAQDEK